MRNRTIEQPPVTTPIPKKIWKPTKLYCKNNGLYVCEQYLEIEPVNIKDVLQRMWIVCCDVSPVRVLGCLVQIIVIGYILLLHDDYNKRTVLLQLIQLQMQNHSPTNRLNQNYYQGGSDIQKLLFIELKLFYRYFCSLLIRVQINKQVGCLPTKRFQDTINTLR